MSYYVFFPEDKTSDETFAFVEQAFTPEECNRIIQLGSKELKQSVIAGQIIDEKIRKSENSWICYCEDNKWLFDKLCGISLKINKQFWNLDLRGFYDNIQFTKYNEGYHYDWHKDYGKGMKFPRKLSLVLQLSDIEDYEGGNLEFFQQDKLKPIPNKKGDIIFFPATEWHRVNKVLSGTRYSLVTWIS